MRFGVMHDERSLALDSGLALGEGKRYNVHNDLQPCQRQRCCLSTEYNEVRIQNARFAHTTRVLEILDVVPSQATNSPHKTRRANDRLRFMDYVRLSEQ